MKVSVTLAHTEGLEGELVDSALKVLPAIIKRSFGLDTDDTVEISIETPLNQNPDYVELMVDVKEPPKDYGLLMLKRMTRQIGEELTLLVLIPDELRQQHHQLRVEVSIDSEFRSFSVNLQKDRPIWR